MPWIAYQGPAGLSLVRADGTDDHLFPGNAAAMRHPDWSPDGEWLAYRLEGLDNTVSIWIARVDGTDARMLISRDLSNAYVDDPAWSPDGSRIAFWLSDSETPQSIVIMDVASGDEIARVAGSAGEGPAVPRWSASGDRLVVEVGRYSATGDLLGSYVGVIELSLPSPVITPISAADTRSGYPDWSPTQDLIVYQAGNLDPFSAAGDPVQLFTVQPDGDRVRQLTTRAATDPFVALPAWTADGRDLLVTLIHSNERFTLARMAADGSGLKEILDPSGQPIVGAHTRIAPH